MKRAGRVFALLMIALMFFGEIGGISYAAGTEANRMNVVFVMDASGSMRRTDKDTLRYEALDLFLGLSTESGNYMGAVIFDQDIVLKQDIQLINSADEKNALSQQVRSAKVEGDTNIGLALKTATEMLETQGNPALPSVIIMLSDGNTDLGNDQNAMNKSLVDKSEAITNARNNSIRVYSVCLNTDGSADVHELEEISNATSGNCVEVNSAGDLKDVFNQFYNIIYSSKTINLADTNIGENGELDIPFHIPVLGVEEANIIINTVNPNTSYSLFRPDGNAFTDTELDQYTLHAKTFAIIKIPMPEAGDWNLRVRGIPGDQVRIDMVYNVNLTLNAETNPAVNTMVVGDSVDITATVENQEGAVSDPAIYSNFPFTLRTTNTTTGEVNDFVMTPGNVGVAYHFTANKTGGYEIQVFCKIEDVDVQSQIIKIAVNSNTNAGPANTPPEASDQEITIKKNVSPLAKSASHTEDLSKYVTDAEDTVLDYQLDDLITTADSKLINLNGEKLELELKKMNDEEIIGIIALDSEGASATFNVHVIITRNLPIWLIILPILLLLAIIVIVIVAVKKSNRMLRGKVTAYSFNEDGLGAAVTFDGMKGKMILRRYMEEDVDPGIDLSSVWVVAGEQSSFIYLMSKGGLYTENAPDTKNKKIRLDGGIEVTAWSVNSGDRGIKIKYIPDEDVF